MEKRCEVCGSKNCEKAVRAKKWDVLVNFEPFCYRVEAVDALEAEEKGIEMFQREQPLLKDVNGYVEVEEAVPCSC